MMENNFYNLIQQLTKEYDDLNLRYRQLNNEYDQLEKKLNNTNAQQIVDEVFQKLTPYLSKSEINKDPYKNFAISFAVDKNKNESEATNLVNNNLQKLVSDETLKRLEQEKKSLERIKASLEEEKETLQKEKSALEREKRSLTAEKSNLIKSINALKEENSKLKNNNLMFTKYMVDLDQMREYINNREKDFETILSSGYFIDYKLFVTIINVLHSYKELDLADELISLAQEQDKFLEKK